jgi:glycosyltransferase involved in cell wall biosynthesis
MNSNKKILIFYPIVKERCGGPPTYLFNLKQFVLENNLEDYIHFLSDFILHQEAVQTNYIKRIIVNIGKNILLFLDKNKKIYNNILIFLFIQKMKGGKSAYHYINEFSINIYDYIHFHSAYDVCLFRRHLVNFKGKIILTSHTPEAPHLEFLSDFDNMNIKYLWAINKKGFDWFETMAFRTIPDYIIFPCKEAEEPYYNTYPLFKSIFSEKRIKYVPTGIPSAKIKLSRSDIRKRYNINENEIVICYVGRHSEIKGYDILLKFGETILAQHDNITFIIAGKEYPLSGLKHGKWKEIGWTDDPHSIINASDLFVLPNREAYFDLILLEVMSLGKPIMLSYTGGNKYFKKFLSKGLMYFKNGDIDDMTSVFRKNINNFSSWNEYGGINQKIFSTNFTANIFGNN